MAQRNRNWKKVPQRTINKLKPHSLYDVIHSDRLHAAIFAGIMKTPLIYMLVAALVLAQGLRLCVHTPDAANGEPAQASLVHYESDSVPNEDDAGQDFDVTYLLQGMDFHNLLAGMSAFTLLLISLLNFAGHDRRFTATYGAKLRPSDGFRLRPPLRAPPL
jgi:hypothetical protein